ncbi:hypothetical protein E2C01_088757 [Portunus trituberculatus]|uniref:Uncharacterized protein n=1 Tax=Portunus trituberculatus TaxID=210409 RepID=A0A5B7JGX6_PORTR|nr:hypothetical protein [Portunus trituberculatus]
MGESLGGGLCWGVGGGFFAWRGGRINISVCLVSFLVSVCPWDVISSFRNRIYGLATGRKVIEIAEKVTHGIKGYNLAERYSLGTGRAYTPLWRFFVSILRVRQATATCLHRGQGTQAGRRRLPRRTRTSCRGSGAVQQTVYRRPIGFESSLQAEGKDRAGQDGAGRGGAKLVAHLTSWLSLHQRLSPCPSLLTPATVLLTPRVSPAPATCCLA